MEFAEIIDIDHIDDIYFIHVHPNKLIEISDWLSEFSIDIQNVETSWIPSNMVECDDENINSNNILISRLEMIDDVDHIYHNMSMVD